MKKNIVITGASGGLGKALAREYLRLGHQVFGCGRTKETEIDALHYTSVDLVDFDEVATWLSDVISETARIDLCVNCAGSLTSSKMLWEYDSEEITSMIDINVFGLINLTRVLIPQMKQQAYGSFITMASNPAGYPIQGLGLYAICKTAIEKLIAILGEELPENLIAVALYPGLINTPMLRKSIGKEAADAYQRPEEWAQQAGSAIMKIDKRYQGQHISLEELLG